MTCSKCGGRLVPASFIASALYCQSCRAYFASASPAESVMSITAQIRAAIADAVKLRSGMEDAIEGRYQARSCDWTADDDAAFNAYCREMRP